MIKRTLANIRLKLISSVKFFGYSDLIMKGILKSYLGHDKIIHFRKNFPVISLLTPALFSKPSANFFVKVFQGVIQNRKFPIFLSFAISNDCNANCSHCSFFSKKNNQPNHILTADECKRAIAEAQSLGVSVISLVGGEPLLKEELEEIIKSIDKDLSTVTIFTNGWLLAEKVPSLKSSGLESVYVSIDSSDKHKHDKIRGKKGLFEKAVEGISIAKKHGLTVGISCCIGKEDFYTGELDKLIELGKNLGVHEIIIFDKVPTGRLENCNELTESDWKNDLISSIKKYNDDYAYPGVVAYSYLSNYQGYGCMGGTRYLYISPSGNVSPCDFNHASFGNILEEPLFKIWDRMSSRAEFNQTTWGGCKMRNPKYRNNPEVVKSSF